MDEEYITLDEFCGKTKYAKQSTYNLIHSGKLKFGVHYVKPSGRLLFKLSAVQEWLERPPDEKSCLPEQKIEARVDNGNKVPKTRKACTVPAKCRINI